MKLASETDLYERYPDLSRLAKALQRAKGEFALFFVECNVVTLRHELARSLTTRLQSLPIEINLNTLEGDLQHISLDELLALRVQEEPDDAVIFLFGLERLLPTQSAERLRATVQQLNWRRSFFSQLKRPLVIWLPRYALNLLAEKTPDFYDWYSGVFIFLADTQSTQQEENKTLQEMWNGEAHASEYASENEKKQWLRTLKGLLEEHPQLDSTRADLLINLGRLHKSLGDYTSALELYQETLSIRKNLKDKAEESITLNNISQVYAISGDYEKALQHLKQALLIIQKTNNKGYESVILNNMGDIYRIRGDYESAMKCFENSFITAQAINNKNSMSVALNNMAATAHALGDLDKALNHLEKSIIITKSINNKFGEGRTLQNIGEIYRLKKDYKTAISYLQQSLIIQEEIGDKQGIAATLNCIAQTFKANGDYETTIDYIKKSLSIQEEIGDIQGLCATLFNLATLEWQSGDQDKAIKTWIKTYGIAKKLGYTQALQSLEKVARQIDIPDGLQGWEKLAQQMNAE